MMHYKNYDFGRECHHCGAALAMMVDSGPNSFNDNRSFDFVLDKNEWLSSPDCCQLTNPVTMSVFDSESQYSSFGFDEDRIEISDDLLKERMRDLTPLYRKDGKIYRIEIPHLRNTAFTWGPTLLDEVSFEEFIVTPTFHGCGAAVFFKPSIAEVVAQLPMVVGKTINAFFVDNESILVCRDGGGHLAPTHWGAI